MDWLVEQVGGSYRIAHSLGRSPCHLWGVGSARDVFRLLMLVRPHLVIKQYLADDTLGFLAARYGERINDHKTDIKWTTHSVIHWLDCLEVSPGCDYWYAGELARV